MHADENTFAPLAVAGDGFYDAYLALEPGPHLRFPRHDHHDRIHAAVTLKGADLEGGMRDGRSSFELNAYAPRGVVESDGDRCILATLEFLSVNLESSSGGRLHFTGLLTGAETYPQDVHDRIAAGIPLTEIAELQGDYDSIRYLPPRYIPLRDYFGWIADVRLIPRPVNG
ncbi:hypothetical protein Achl_4325 (plasmid) [Pseudarthrobacter chlorophenolicus A6]|uniref:Uncharacterized protein n=1 Tax=Pseudarthrobacter chlorophenolicus (strain ATCC 700700 / DSM 12829 / CIP 107037 / JCM 12360 / KCTC 9906 / NCIMB 13794 / A6) TaxID=452863 RepID=B8HIM9_PSECP|nr:hypothetical protein [Pseudarthrobacter chlorophenolicus]ACL42276.1 hypothetical protein Achl_4325 [Pseudarthrobacter chlorophenolicus A6]SDQ15818.1 hypothetical protein SAMN04489738_0383 [Pseudarthrobacter chlorophenolicus]